MLLFCTTLPLLEGAIQRDCVELFAEWVCQSPYYPLDTLDVDEALERGFEFRQDNFACQITHFKDEKTVITACRLENNQPNGLWLSDCVYVDDPAGARVHIQVKCNRQDFRVATQDVKTPNIVYRFIESGLCRDDGWMPVSASPIRCTEDDLENVARIMRGEGDNRMPVVYLSNDGWGWALDPDKTARNMTGLAHVLVEDDAAFALRLMDMTDGNNAHRGYVAIYMPQNSTRYLFNANSYLTPGALNSAVRRALLQCLVNRWDTSDFGWEQLRPKQNRQRLQEQAATHSLKAAEWEELFTSVDADLKEKEETITRLRVQLEDLQYQLNNANGHLSSLQQRKDGKSSDGFFSRGPEPELVEGEYVDLLRNVLQYCRNLYPGNSHAVMMIDSMLKANERVGMCAKTLKGIKDVLSEKGRLDASKESTLKQLGFRLEKEHDSNGHRSSYFVDPRFRFTFACTPSSNRAGKNQFSDIRKVLDVEWKFSAMDDPEE